jgi:hypothetical protein
MVTSRWGKDGVIPADTPALKYVYEQEWSMEIYISCELVKSYLYKVEETVM